MSARPMLPVPRLRAAPGAPFPGAVFTRALRPTALLLVSAVALAEPPPPLTGDSPLQAAPVQVTAASGDAAVAVGALNPHMSQAPLWLWVEPQGGGGGHLRLEDGDGRVLWNTALAEVPSTGRMVVVPRPLDHKVMVVVSGNAGAAPRSAELALAGAGASRLAQVGLPIVLVGGAQASSLALAVRDRVEDRPVVALTALQLPHGAAVLAGAANVVVTADAALPDDLARELSRFACARGGVMTVGGPALPPAASGCAQPPQLAEGGSLPALLSAITRTRARLGALEELGPQGMFGPAPTDESAAAAVLAHRPSGRMAVSMLLIIAGLMVLGLVGAGRLSPGLALGVMAAIPLAGGVAMATGLALAGGAPSQVEWLVVDALPGAPLALYRRTTVARAPGGSPVDPEAWVSVRVAPTPPAGASTPSPSPAPAVREEWGVLSVHAGLKLAPHPAEPGASVVQAGVDRSSAVVCGREGRDAGWSGADRQLGRLLHDRCQLMAGTAVTLASAQACPGLGGWLAAPVGPGAVRSAFLMLAAERGVPP